MQRVGFFAVLPPLLHSLGADSSEVIREAGLEAGALDNPEKFIPYDTAGRLLTIAAAKSHCPHLGLLLGQHIGTAALGLVGELMRSAPTLGEALRHFAAQQHHNSRGGLVYLLQQREKTFLGYAIYEPNVEGNSHICDTAAMAAYTIIRELSSSSLLDRMVVLISRAAPLDPTPYKKLFDAQVQFNASQTAAMVPNSCLSRRLVTANTGRRKALEHHFKTLSATSSQSSALSVVTRLRLEVRVGLLTGTIRGDQFAANLKMNRRTLHRRLAEEGTSFQQILDETRCEFARQLLTYTRLTIGEIGEAVQFSGPGIFTRAFIRWTGTTPTAWRENTESITKVENNLSSFALTT